MKKENKLAVRGEDRRSVGCCGENRLRERERSWLVRESGEGESLWAKGEGKQKITRGVSGLKKIRGSQRGSLLFSQKKWGRRLPCTEDRFRENFRVFCGLGFLVVLFHCAKLLSSCVLWRLVFIGKNIAWASKLVPQLFFFCKFDFSCFFGFSYHHCLE